MDPLTAALLIQGGTAVGGGLMEAFFGPDKPDYVTPATNALKQQKIGALRQSNRQLDDIYQRNASAGLSAGGAQRGVSDLLEEYGSIFSEIDARAADTIINLKRQQEIDNYNIDRSTLDNRLGGLASIGNLASNYFLTADNFPTESLLPVPETDTELVPDLFRERFSYDDVFDPLVYRP